MICVGFAASSSHQTLFPLHFKIPGKEVILVYIHIRNAFSLFPGMSYILRFYLFYLFFIMSSPDFHVCASFYSHPWLFFFFLRFPNQLLVKDPQALTRKSRPRIQNEELKINMEAQTSVYYSGLAKQSWLNFLLSPGKLKPNKIKQMRGNYYPIAVKCVQPLHPLGPPRMGRIYHFPGNCIRKAISPLPSPSTFLLKS